MRKILTLVTLALFCVSVEAQITSQRARSEISGTAVPNAPCNPGPIWRDVYIRTTDNSEYQCTAAPNVWTKVTSGSPSPAFNVKDYGALGNTRSATDGTTTNGSPLVDSATAVFTDGDIGRYLFVVFVDGTVYIKGTVISRQSATRVTLSANATGTTSTGRLVIGTDDTAAIIAAKTACDAVTPKGVLYAPTGRYLFSGQVINNSYSPQAAGVSVVGDGMTSTIFELSAAYDTTGVVGGLFSKFSNGLGVNWKGFTVEGNGFILTGAGSLSAAVFGSTHNGYLQDVQVRNFANVAVGFDARFDAECTIVNARAEFNAGINLFINGFGGTFIGGLVSNGTGRGLVINGTAYVKWIGGLIDEQTGMSVDITAATNISFHGTKIYGGVGITIFAVDGTSQVVLDGVDIEPFAGHNNDTALSVASGGIVRMASSTLTGTGTGKALNNSGTVYDNGGNLFTGGMTGNVPQHILAPGTDIIMGGATSAFPMIRRSGATVQFKTADGVSDADIRTGAQVAAGLIQAFSGINLATGSLSIQAAGLIRWPETSATAGVGLGAAGIVEVNAGTLGSSGVLLLRGRTFAQLPASPIAGMRTTVTDSNTETWGATVAGGGAFNVEVRYNGTVWTVVGK